MNKDSIWNQTDVGINLQLCWCLPSSIVSVRGLHSSRTVSELSGMGNKTKENVLFTAETQDDFFFIPPTKSHSQLWIFKYIEIGVLSWLSLATHQHALLTQARRDLFQLLSVKPCANTCARANEKEKFLSMH